MSEPLNVLTRFVDIENSQDLQVAEKNGAYASLRKGIKDMDPDKVLAELKAANLRGRGGAGFPAGIKLGFMPKGGDRPLYILCNADESEPGTFKDRLILYKDPHLLIEGLLLACYATTADNGIIYIRGEFPEENDILEKAIVQAREKGYIGDNILGSGWNCNIRVYRGAGAYICGEETALIESLEGKRGMPRIKPPFPAQYGYMGHPSNVNNVETLACIPSIVERGGEWFKAIGPEGSPGPKLYCVSGHVNKPGVYEFPMGVNLLELVYDHCGGMLNDIPLKAVIPGGASVPVLRADECDVAMDFDSLRAKGTLLGSAAVMVMNETVCMVKSLQTLSRFYAHESCGQCTPCREGSPWLFKMVDRLERGEGKESDLDLLHTVASNMEGRTICALGDAAAWPVKAFVTKFRDEFLHHVTEKKCLAPGERMTTRWS